MKIDKLNIDHGNETKHLIENLIKENDVSFFEN
jgi:hypothetical protein